MLSEPAVIEPDERPRAGGQAEGRFGHPRVWWSVRQWRPYVRGVAQRRRRRRGVPAKLRTPSKSDSASQSAISVFGLGYVGCVSAACFAARGHTVLGVDSNPQKTDFIREGTRRSSRSASASSSPTWSRPAPDRRRSGLGRDGERHHHRVRGHAVGPRGALSTTYLESATAEIGEALTTKDGWHVVVYRSTMVPGTCEGILIPILERMSGKRAGIDFGSV